PDLDDLERRMKGAFEKLRQEFAGLRMDSSVRQALAGYRIDELA
ncbi:MAG: ribosome recycling factor, partial [Proteobacteria bacterium]|nr:ribosome recycling factor [Pseudomonadota bacterium]